MKVHKHYVMVSDLAILNVLTSVPACHLPLFNE